MPGLLSNVGFGGGGGGAVPAGGKHFEDNELLTFGNTDAAPDTQLSWNTAQTADALYLGLATAQNTFVIGELGDAAFDFAHAAQTNPTIFLHSAAQATDQWISFAHNQTNALLGVGLGDLILTIPGGNLVPSANDAWALGVSGTAISDLFLASGAVINFAAADVTLTHAANSLTLAGGSLVSTMGASEGTLTNLDLSQAGTTYATNAAMLDITRTGNLTGVATETIVDVLVNPSFTLTEPAAGVILYDVVSISAASVLVTAGAGGSDITALRVVAGTDADASNNYAILTTGTVAPATTDTSALGTASLGFSDLFLASGAVINFAASDALITHSAGRLTFSTPITVTTSMTIPSILATSTTLELNSKSITAANAFAVNVGPTWSNAATSHTAMRIDSTQTGGASTPTQHRGLSVVLTHNTSGTVTNTQSIDIATPVTAGTLTTVVGLDINDQSLALSTNAYGIRIASQTANATTTRAIEISGTGVNNAIRFGTDIDLYNGVANTLNIVGGGLNITENGLNRALTVVNQTTTYTTTTGRGFDTASSGAISGTAGTNFSEVRIAPAFTLTNPGGAGTVSFYGLDVDLSSLAVTASVGSSTVYAGRFVGSTDADITTTRALYASGGVDYVLAATQQMNIDATVDRTSNTTPAILLNVDFGADGTLGLGVEGISRGDFNGVVAISSRMTSGGMLTALDGSSAFDGQVTGHASDIANTSVNSFNAISNGDGGGLASLNGLNVGTGFDAALFLQSGNINWVNYQLVLLETNGAGAASGMAITTAAGVTSGAGGNLSFTTGAGAGAASDGGDFIFTGGVGAGTGLQGEIRTSAGTDLSLTTGGRFYGGGVQVNSQALAANTNLTLDENDSQILVTLGSTSDNTITLPAASGNEGMIIHVYITDGAGTNNAVVTRAGGDTIANGSADLANTTVTLGDTGDFVMLMCVNNAGTGDEWNIVAQSGVTVA